MLQGFLTACAGKDPEVARDASVQFVCAGGTTFRVTFLDGQVRVTTSAKSYDLDFRPSSVGRKYSTNDTTFIEDEERAVLTGAEGGPFHHCREA